MFEQWYDEDDRILFDIISKNPKRTMYPYERYLENGGFLHVPGEIRLSKD